VFARLRARTKDWVDHRLDDAVLRWLLRGMIAITAAVLVLDYAQRQSHVQEQTASMAPVTVPEVGPDISKATITEFAPVRAARAQAPAATRRGPARVGDVIRPARRRSADRDRHHPPRHRQNICRRDRKARELCEKRRFAFARRIGERCHRDGTSDPAEAIHHRGRERPFIARRRARSSSPAASSGAPVKAPPSAYIR